MTKNQRLGRLVLTAGGLLGLSSVAMAAGLKANEIKIEEINREDLSIPERVQLLESKIDSHDKELAEKLSDCHLEYKKLGRRATWCPDGTVVTEVEKIYGTEMLNVSCAKPILRCVKLGVQIEL